jgi:hypothetical protein
LAGTNLSAYIWSVVELLRGDYKQKDFGQVIHTNTVLRHQNCEPERGETGEAKN